MTKQVRITYVKEIVSQKTPGKILKQKGEQNITVGDRTQGLIAAMEYAPGSNTQTTNPALDFAAGDVRQTRSFLRSCLGIAQGGNPGDVFELLVDGVVYRRTTRENLVTLYGIYETMNTLKREAYPLIERVAEFPKKDKKTRTETDDEQDDDENIW